MTDATNCFPAPVGTVALVGLTVTTIPATPVPETTVTVADAVTLGVATLLTIMLTTAGEGATAGAE